MAAAAVASTAMGQTRIGAVLAATLRAGFWGSLFHGATLRCIALLAAKAAILRRQPEPAMLPVPAPCAFQIAIGGPGDVRVTGDGTLPRRLCSPRFDPDFPSIPVVRKTGSTSDIVRTGNDNSISAHFVGSIVYIEMGLYQVG
jgi:hypothetical protein